MTYEELKALGKKSSALKKKVSMEKNIYLSLGATNLDLMAGGAKNVFGVKCGTILNIVGDSSTGKTAMMTELIVSNYFTKGEKFRWCYDDSENAYTFNTQGMYGFNVVDENSPHSQTVEELYYNIRKFLQTVEEDEFGVYVVDSLDAISSQEIKKLEDDRLKAMEAGKEFDQGSYKMAKAKFLSTEFFPTLTYELAQKNILLVIISQVRDNINPMSFEKYTRAGGKALDFYSSMIIWTANLKKIVRQETVVGGNILAKMTKGKVERPFRTCQYSFYFDYGIDDVGSMLDYLYTLRTPTGELSSSLAKNIAWESDETKLKVDSTNVKKFLQTENAYAEAIATCKNNRFDLNTVLDFIMKNEVLRMKYEDQFEKVMERDALISYIENNNLQDELRNRVINKWETFEDSIKTKRVKKYGTQPRSVE